MREDETRLVFELTPDEVAQIAASVEFHYKGDLMDRNSGVEVKVFVPVNGKRTEKWSAKLRAAAWGTVDRRY